MQLWATGAPGYHRRHLYGGVRPAKVSAGGGQSRSTTHLHGLHSQRHTPTSLLSPSCYFGDIFNGASLQIVRMPSPRPSSPRERELGVTFRVTALLKADKIATCTLSRCARGRTARHALFLRRPSLVLQLRCTAASTEVLDPLRGNYDNHLYAQLESLEFRQQSLQVADVLVWALWCASGGLREPDEYLSERGRAQVFTATLFSRDSLLQLKVAFQVS